MDPGTTRGNLGVWNLVPRPTNNQYFPNGQYNITSAARIARSCNGILNAVACTAGNGVNLDGGALGRLLVSSWVSMESIWRIIFWKEFSRE